MSRPSRVLVVDDEPNMCRILGKVLSAHGHEVRTATSAEEGLRLLEQVEVDAVLTDVRMPGMDGIEFLRRVKGLQADLSVIIMTAFGSVETAVSAMKNGATDYITKPLNNEEVALKVDSAIERKRLLRRNRELEQALHSQLGLGDMIGTSPAMRAVFELIQRVAPTESTVLITGESGTGKDLVAQQIHRQSPRASARFLPVNCGALPRSLIESELFGHERGAFTGAVKRKEGLFEAASGGTVFLDEIGELDTDLQVQLLRVLETHQVRRVGGTEPVTVDFRLIAATNRDLEQAMQDGRFREDLYFRLSVVPIHLPPLRERREDIPLLVEHFLGLHCRKHNRPVPVVSPDAMQLLLEYGYPGNVRELEHLIERIVIVCDQPRIEVANLPASLHRRRTEDDGGTELYDLPYQRSKEAFERRYFTRLLANNNHNVTRAAIVANMSRRNLQEKMRKYNLRGDE